MKVTFSGKMMSNLSYLSKNILSRPEIKLPKLTSLGNDIETVQELADVMGIDLKVAAAYALQGDLPQLKGEAEEVLAPGVYNAFEDGYEPVMHYAYRIANKMSYEEKGIRLVRDQNGAKYFNLPIGSIIVADGRPALDAITAAPNDVPGYEKVVDKQGNAYYIGREQNKWVVRSGATKQIIQQTDKAHGEQDMLYWLNAQLGGRVKEEKSMENNIEKKRQFTTLAVEKLGKQGHAFRNKNGTYSYPIATVADLKNAIQAFGRAAPEDREKLKAFIKKRARQLGESELIPDDWKTGEPEDLEEKYDTSSLDRSPNSNWVEETGDLPSFIRAIAHALIREHGFSTSRAIATAVNRVKKWSVDPDVSAKTRAKALKAVAQWQALKAKNKARVAARKAKS